MSPQAQAVVQAQPKTAEASSLRGNLLQRAAVIPAITPVHHGILQRCSGGVECEECRQKRLEREGTLQRAAVSAAPVSENGVPPIVHEVLGSPGQSLDAGTRAFMEPRFGYDFSSVRVHTDARAAESARAVSALAYTVGRDVVFGEGEYAPGTSEGRRLLAHELTHVVQQRSNGLQSKLTIGGAGDAYEQEADQVADVLIGRDVVKVQPGAITSPITPSIQRTCGPGALGSPHPDCTHSTGDVSGEVFYFVVNCDDLQPGESTHLSSFARGLPRGTGLNVHGYASTDGDASFNMALSCHRANKVATMLRTARPDLTITTPNLKHGATSGPAFFRRSVVVESTPSTPAVPATPTPVTPGPGPSPVPAPTPTPSRFICGPDVTTQVRDAVDHTKTTFAGRTGTQKENACHDLISLVTGGFAWDINELHNNAWILRYRPSCASQYATPHCGSSVQVGTDCHYAGSANYVIFGVMCKLCHTHFTMIGSPDASKFTESEMLEWINKYKGTGFTGLATPVDNFVPSQNWATAGFRGWPSASAPAGDRSNCSPSCPLPYTGSAFLVHWVPMGWF